MTLKETVKKYADIIGAVYSIVTSLITIVFAIQAYGLLTANLKDLQQLLDNWQALPISNVTVVASNQACPSGFSTLDNIRTWPGTNAGCYCPTSNSTLRVSSGLSTSTCSTNQTIASCFAIPAQSSVQLTTWRASKICMMRSGISSFSRPEIKSGACSTGYKLCGASSYDLGGHCAPVSSPCPITSMVIDLTSLSATMVSNNYSALPLDATYSLYVRRSGYNERPVIDLTQVEGQVNCKPDRGTPGYGSRVSLSPYGQQALLKSGALGAGCSAQDPRFSAWDTQAEFSNFAENNVNPLWWYNSTTYKTSWMARPEIQWKTTCRINNDYSAAKLKDQTDPLKSVVSAQGGLVAIACIAGFVIGIFFPALVLYSYFKKKDEKSDLICFKGGADGQTARDRMKQWKKVLTSILNIAKIIPAAITVVISSSIYEWYNSLGGQTCSDVTTNDTITFLGGALTDLRAANMKTLIIIIITLVVDVLLWVKSVVQKKKAGKVKPVDNNDKDIEMNNSSAPAPAPAPVAPAVHAAPTPGAVAPVPVAGQPMMMMAPGQPMMMAPGQPMMMMAAPAPGQPMMMMAPGQPMMMMAPGQPMMMMAAPAPGQVMVDPNTGQPVMMVPGSVPHQ